MLYHKPIKNLQHTIAAILLAVVVLFAQIGVVLHTHHCKHCNTFQKALWNTTTCTTHNNNNPPATPQPNSCCQKKTKTCHTTPQIINNAPSINPQTQPCCTLSSQYLSQNTNAVTLSLTLNKYHHNHTAFWNFAPPFPFYTTLLPNFVFYPPTTLKKYIPTATQQFPYALHTKPPPRLFGKLFHIFIQLFLN